MVQNVRGMGHHRLCPRCMYPVALVLVLVLAPTLTGAQPLPTELLAEARQALDAGQWAQALEHYRQFVAEHPEHEAVVLAQFGTGECLFQLRRYEEALGCYRLVIERHPDWSDAYQAHFRVGNCLLHMERYEEAAQAFSHMLEHYPGSPVADQAAYWRGEALYHSDAPEPAMAAYQQSLQLVPDGEYAAYALYSIAAIQLQTDVEAAISTLQQLLQQYPDSEPIPEALYSLGRAHEALEQLEASLSYYEQVVAQHGDSHSAADALAGIASVQFSQGKLDDAFDTYRQVVERYPGTDSAVQASLRAADVRFAAQRYAEAAQLYAEIAADGDSPVAAAAAYWLGLAYSADGQTEQAADALETFLKHYPTDEHSAQAHLCLASLYCKMDRPDEAHQAYEQAATLSQEPELILQARYGMAWADYQQKPAAEILESFVSVLSSDPRSETTSHNALAAAELCMAEGAYQSAAELAQLILDYHPTHPQ